MGLVTIGATLAVATVMVRVALPVPAEFVAPSDTTVTPTTFGVPVSAPVKALSVTPGGNGLALYVVGPFEAAMAKLKATPTVPAAVSGELVMAGTPVPVTVKLWRSMLDS